MAFYALTIFTGAFLLFQVQPLIGKYILPWFGGGPGIWTTCMLFFQVVLVGGYAYAHAVSRWATPRKQVIVQVLLVALALCLLPITPSDAWKPSPTDDPMLRILALLAATLGLPYVVLSSTGPLMQHWFALSCPGRSPYRLFALSNLGSLLALVSYPFYFESHFTRRQQSLLWSAGLVLYGIFTLGAAWRLWRAGSATAPAIRTTEVPEQAPAVESERSRFAQVLLWLLLPACASALLLATTNKLCLDVAVVPFLWVLPLAVYLLSFIVAFDSPRWYARFPFTIGLALALAGFCWAMFKGSDWPVWRQAAVYGSALFICCLVCHGELYRMRPAASRLTSFYLCISVGGALGGLFVAVVAPAVFKDYYELHWALLGCAVLFVAALALSRDRAPASYWRWLGLVAPVLAAIGLDRWLAHMQHAATLNGIYYAASRGGLWLLLAVLVTAWFIRRKTQPSRTAGFGWLALGTTALGVALWLHGRETDPDVMLKSRNFYGVLTVFNYNREQPESHHYMLQHGRITHGLQFTDKDQSHWATTYFGQETGVGIAMRSLKAGTRRVGIVGLGTGTLAAYGQQGDVFRFYEINPQVERIAKSPFSYLEGSGAKVEVARGDARLVMEREPAQNYDLLILDAFSSDSIPVHLLTREAVRVYERHLKPGGILAVHISNHYLDLQPIVRRLAADARLTCTLIDYEEREEAWWVYSATWMLLSHDPAVLKTDLISDSATEMGPLKADAQLWTDDFASLFPILIRE